MKIVVIGAVAGGTSAAAKARRNMESAQITVYEKGEDISYSGCSMPYYLGGKIANKTDLTPRDSKFFKKKYNVDIFIKHEVTKIDTSNKTVHVLNLKDNVSFVDNYDKLIIATGATPLVPKVEGIDLPHVFTLRTIENMERIKKYLELHDVKNALVIGSGFVGLELCENLVNLGINVTIVEKQANISPSLDSDLSPYIQSILVANGVKVLTNTTVRKIASSYCELDNNIKVNADMVFVCIGVRPNTQLANDSMIALGVNNAIKVDKTMQTNIADIYACGDCTEQTNLITQLPMYHPLGSTANKTGRIAGDSATGGNLSLKGIVGTSIFGIFKYTVAQTGLTQKQADALNYSYTVCHNIKPDKPTFFGGTEMVIKALADNKTDRLLGVQIVGKHGVDKRIDVFATAITYGAKVQDLFELDLAYSPLYSTTKDPVMYTGMILDNAMHNGRKLITENELRNLIKSNDNYTLLDTRAKTQYENRHINTAINIEHATVRDSIENIDKQSTVVTYCNKGTTGNAVQNILLGNGFDRVFNLSGGEKHFNQTNKTKEEE